MQYIPEHILQQRQKDEDSRLEQTAACIKSGNHAFVGNHEVGYWCLSCGATSTTGIIRALPRDMSKQS